jgi:ketosteroid isomerase-like protein
MNVIGRHVAEPERHELAGRWAERRVVGCLVASLLLVVAVAGCGAPAGSAAAASNVQKQADLYAINQIEVTWHKASSTKDLDLMMSLWADDATFTTAAKTYSGKAAIRDFFATQAAPFKPENDWVSDTPAYKSRVTVDGDKGTLYFQCDYIDVATKKVQVVVSADQQVARVNGIWLIKATISATPGLGSY